MSDTITDLPKITQMLDAGWRVRVYKNGLGSYTADAFHPSDGLRHKVRIKLQTAWKEIVAKQPGSGLHPVDVAAGDWDDKERLITDDFTPEQALTRLAYKVHGEII